MNSLCFLNIYIFLLKMSLNEEKSDLIAPLRQHALSSDTLPQVRTPCPNFGYLFFELKEESLRRKKYFATIVNVLSVLKLFFASEWFFLFRSMPTASIHTNSVCSTQFQNSEVRAFVRSQGILPYNTFIEFIIDSYLVYLINLVLQREERKQHEKVY